MDPCTRKLGMQSELHRNNMYQSVELLLLVSMLFLLSILKCLLIVKGNFYYTRIHIYVSYVVPEISIRSYRNGRMEYSLKWNIRCRKLHMTRQID